MHQHALFARCLAGHRSATPACLCNRLVQKNILLCAVPLSLQMSGSQKQTCLKQLTKVSTRADCVGRLACALQSKPVCHHSIGFDGRVKLQEPVAIPEDQLPLTLPPTQDFAPSGRAESPLAKITDWVQTTDPSTGTHVCSALCAVQHCCARLQYQATGLALASAMHRSNAQSGQCCRAQRPASGNSMMGQGSSNSILALVGDLS